jgi:hypothetical protein
LPVYSRGFMSFREYNVQAPFFRNSGAQFDISAPAGHIGGNGYSTEIPGSGDDGGLFLILLGV